MISIVFRMIDEDGLPNGFYGIAVAPTMVDLFWKIDEHCDPWSCEISTLKYGSIFFNTIKSEKNDDDDIQDSEPYYSPIGDASIKFSDYLDQYINGYVRWRNPMWDLHKVYGSLLKENSKEVAA